MVSPKLARAFMMFWWTLGLVLAYLSIHTVVDGLSAPRTDWHAVVIGLLEAVGALLFLVPSTLRFGAIGLLAILALAFGLHLLQGQFAAPVLAYAAGVYFVLVHGPVAGAPSQPPRAGAI